jgi:hypothetical protein
MDDNSKQDVMSAGQIVVELRRLIDQEKAEAGPEMDRDVSDLEDAIESVMKFITDEQGESNESTPAEIEPEVNPEDVVDTSLLTGSLSGLKSFLVKKAQDNQNQQ